MAIERSSLPKIWQAPAKINLFLHVLGKRADGYHELQTVFQLLDYADEMTFDLNHLGMIARSYELGFDEDVDLCLRAARLLHDYASSDCGVTIGLNKQIPIGGGLGGGSSNAATTLIALNRLWNINLSRVKLAELGLQLGADVPVFVQGQSAWAEGVGEQLTPLKLPENWFVVLTPPIEVSTARVFAHKHLTASTQMLTIRAFHKEQTENQLEPIVRVEYPEVDALLKWLSRFTDSDLGEPRMSGTGSSVFLRVVSRLAGEKILAEKPEATSGFVAKGLNFHPLYQPSDMFEK